MNAGSFGPGKLDKTFGTTQVFVKYPPTQNASPFAGFQSLHSRKLARVVDCPVRATV